MATTLAEKPTHQGPVRKPMPPGELLIGGRWRPSADGQTMPTIDPTTEETITEVAKGTGADVEAAVLAAAAERFAQVKL